MKVKAMRTTCGVSRTHFDFYLLPYIRLYRLGSYIPELEDTSVKTQFYVGWLLWCIRFTFKTKY